MACKSYLTFFFFFSIYVNQTISQQTQNTDCTNRWIHIRRLSQRFNLDLLSNCSSYPLFDNFCPYLINHGLGPKTHNRSHSWFRSDPLLLEVIFHRRMLEYPCLTSDPNLADAIYLPYYASIDAIRYLYGPDQNTSMDHGVELFRFLTLNDGEIWRRRDGFDHFLVMARPAWDFSQSLDADPPMWGTSFLELPEFYNLTALIVETRFWPWQELGVPYLTSFHPPTLTLLNSWIKRIKNSRRTTFMLFAGGGGSTAGATPNIRRSIRTECENISSNNFSYLSYNEICDLVDCSNGICEHDPIRYMKPILQATFCLQPPGDTPTRRSTFDAIIGGCIPVFFEEQTAKSQYRWHLNEEMYGEFSVFIPKEEVVFKGLRILDVLKGISRARVKKMREKVVELIPRVVYRKRGSSASLRGVKDAFDIAIDGALEKISSRVRRDFDQ